MRLSLTKSPFDLFGRSLTCPDKLARWAGAHSYLRCPEGRFIIAFLCQNRTVYFEVLGKVSLRCQENTGSIFLAESRNQAMRLT